MVVDLLQRFGSNCLATHFLKILKKYKVPVKYRDMGSYENDIMDFRRIKQLKKKKEVWE